MIIFLYKAIKTIIHMGVAIMGEIQEWTTKILTRGDLKKCWDIERTIKPVEDTVRWIGEGKVEQHKCAVLVPNHAGVNSLEHSFCLPHDAWIKPLNVVGDKFGGCNSSNPLNGISYSSINQIICDSVTIRPYAFEEADWLTSLRTSAMAAVAAKYLARPESETVAVVGCGQVGRNHIAALRAAGFNIKKVRAFDIREEAAKNFKADLENSYPVNVTIFSTVAEAAKGADIICGTSTSRKAMILKEMITPGTHLCATCLWDIDMRNILSTVDKWVLGYTRFDRTWLEDKQYDLSKYNNLNVDMTYGDMTEIVCGKKVGRESPEETTVMTHLGMAANDITVGYLAYLSAKEAGLGIDLNLTK
jgi:ornithine cyclodeaminase/alanine dehydrogenase-like protein (mu-crystallin family)